MDTTQKSKEPVKHGRREFLTLAGIAAAGTGLIAGSNPAEAADSDDTRSGRGYQETAHVRTYYELAKF